MPVEDIIYSLCNTFKLLVDQPLLHTFYFYIIYHFFHVQKILILFFLECTIGYFAKNCELRCPYPSYGEECQAICTCPKVTCDFVYGCTKRTRAGNTFSRFFFNQIEKTSLKNVPNDIHLNYSKFLDLIFKTTCFLSLNKNSKRRSINMLTLLVFFNRKHINNPTYNGTCECEKFDNCSFGITPGR